MFSYSLLGLTQMIFAMATILLFGLIVSLVVYARLARTEQGLIDDSATEEKISTK